MSASFPPHGHMTKKSLSHLAEEEWIHAICEADACAARKLLAVMSFLFFGAIMASLAAKGIIIVGNANC